MNDSFPRIITLLRSERKLTQKQAAQSLGISQALLSHYERGIRECGLDFLCKTADFYGVSCDYLLGRTADRTGAQLTVEDIPESDTNSTDKMLRGSAVPVLNKKLIANSLNILFDMLQKAGCMSLTNECSAYLMLAVYKMFRLLYLGNSGNSKKFFSVSEPMARGYSTASMEIIESRIAALAAGKDIEGMTALQNPDALELTDELLTANYPLFSTSLLNLIR
ncbi:MAG: helix-turn-helix transcriptional regulator, partial [Clostridia bacterium]|nr:helix-turn-helix transcriptional regulator [Clostridia bacterium]